MGSFHAGDVGNVIAEYAEMKDTIRCLNAETRETIENAMEEIVQNTAAAYGCKGEVEQFRDSDAVHNDVQAAQTAADCAKMLVSEDQIGGQKH